MTTTVNAAEMASAIADSVTAITAIVAAVAALKALRTWKRELRVRVEFDAARPILRRIYALRNELKQLRFPISVESGSEFSRFNTIKNELSELLLDAEVLWADRLADAKKTLRDLISSTV